MAATQIFTLNDLGWYDGAAKTYWQGKIDTASAKSLKSLIVDQENGSVKFYKITNPTISDTPAFSFDFPITDLSGLIPKISAAQGETLSAGKVVQTKADGTVDTTDLNVSDIATTAALSAVSDKLDDIVGTDTSKTARTIAAEEVAKVVASAPDDFDTLKEIADWIENDTTGAAAMANDIDDLKDKTVLGTHEVDDGKGGTVQEEYATVKAYVEATASATQSAATTASNSYADDLNTAMDTRVDDLETKVGDGFTEIPEATIRALFVEE